MLPPKANDKIIEELKIEEWRRDQAALSNSLGISEKILRRNIPLYIIEALLHDATLYAAHYHEQNNPIE